MAAAQQEQIEIYIAKDAITLSVSRSHGDDTSQTPGFSSLAAHQLPAGFKIDKQIDNALPGVC